MSTLKNKEIALLIRRVELQAGIKQKEIAASIGVSESYLSQVVRGKKNASKNLVNKLTELSKSINATVVDATDDAEPSPLRNETRGMTKDEEGRNKHEFTVDSNGKVTSHHYTVPFSPGLWDRLHKSMEQAGFTPYDADAYIQSLIAEDYRKRFLVATPENQLTEESGKAN